MSAAAAHAEPILVPPAVAAAAAADADADADAPVPAESAAAGSEFGAPAADTAAVQYDLHVSHPVVTPEVQTSIDAFRKSLESEALVQQHPAESARFLSDQNLHRYLRARQFDLKKAHKLIMETLAWRLAYEPESISAAQVESECKTGKIRVLQQLDRHSRPIIVMDPSRENSKNHDSQLRHLVWQLERAKRKMNVRPNAEGAAAEEAQAKPAFVEKYCLFINMERNSIWNSPPLKTSMETLKTLTDRLPEHLGHAIVYKPGLLFAGLWNVCKPVMDPKTVRKVIFVRGDVSDGSANDKLLTEIIGPKWRECYDHDAFWPTVLADEADWHAREAAAKAKAEAAAQEVAVAQEGAAAQEAAPAEEAAPASAAAASAAAEPASQAPAAAQEAASQPQEAAPQESAAAAAAAVPADAAAADK